ncbi:unnamed protein product [Timema podura]|uniref:Uncharacterized protein n=1 Tax=Timema podura TaxID=61482 RepID=A0ABN7NJH5_TIMPD|nr:unnamed protein product [Timema podura]
MPPRAFLVPTAIGCGIQIFSRSMGCIIKVNKTVEYPECCPIHYCPKYKTSRFEQTVRHIPPELIGRNKIGTRRSGRYYALHSYYDTPMRGVNLMHERRGFGGSQSKDDEPKYVIFLKPALRLFNTENKLQYAHVQSKMAQDGRWKNCPAINRKKHSLPLRDLNRNIASHQVKPPEVAQGPSQGGYELGTSPRQERESSSPVQYPVLQPVRVIRLSNNYNNGLGIGKVEFRSTNYLEQGDEKALETKWKIDVNET